MTISKYLHSCLLIEEGGTKLLIDPGRYSFDEGKVKPEQFKDITAVLITHDHGDHADVPALKTILKNNPKAKAYGNGDTKKLLEESGVPVELFEGGTKDMGGISVEAFPTKHQPLLVDPPQNTSFIIGKKVLVTGDTIDERLASFESIPVLASAVAAPWANLVELAKFMVFMKPKHVIPLHDGFLKETALGFQYRMFADHLAGFGIEFHPLGVGESIDA